MLYDGNEAAPNFIKTLSARRRAAEVSPGGGGSGGFPGNIQIFHYLYYWNNGEETD